MRAFLHRVGFSNCTHSVELGTVGDGFDSVCVISGFFVEHYLGLWLSIVWIPC